MSTDEQHSDGSVIEEVEERTTLLAHILEALETSFDKIAEFLLSNQRGIAIARDASATHATADQHSQLAEHAADATKPLAITGLTVAALATLLHIFNKLEEKDYEAAAKTAAGFVGGLQGAIFMGGQGAKIGATMGHAAPIAIPILTITAALIGGFLGERTAKGLTHEAIEAFGHLKVHFKEWLEKHLEEAPLKVQDDLIKALLVGTPELESLAEEYEAAKQDAQTTFELGLSCGLDVGQLSKEFVRSIKESQQEVKRILQEIQAAKTVHLLEDSKELLDPNEECLIAT